MANITKILKSKAVGRTPVVFDTLQNPEGFSDTVIERCAHSILTDKVVPVFSVSSVSGDGLDFLRGFLYHLKPR